MEDYKFALSTSGLMRNSERARSDGHVERGELYGMTTKYLQL